MHTSCLLPFSWCKSPFTGPFPVASQFILEPVECITCTCIAQVSKINISKFTIWSTLYYSFSVIKMNQALSLQVASAGGLRCRHVTLTFEFKTWYGFPQRSIIFFENIEWFHCMKNLKTGEPSCDWDIQWTNGHPDWRDRLPYAPLRGVFKYCYKHCIRNIKPRRA